MSDRLTQLQNAVDQLAYQFATAIYYHEKHHDLAKLGPSDHIRELKPEEKAKTAEYLDIHPPEDFKAAQVELAQDIIVTEQQIEYLVSLLPGLDNSEHDQDRNIKNLEEELQAAEAQHEAAIMEKAEIMGMLDEVIWSIRRP